MTSLKPDAVYFKKQIYITIFITFIVHLFFIPFCLYALDEQKFDGTLVLILGTIFWFILCFVILFFRKVWIGNLSFVIKDSSIAIYKGIFTKIEQNIPNSKVTDFVLYRDLFDRFLGIGSIKVQTAGASGESGFEGVLDGILDYDEVHKNLRDKLVSVQSSISNDSITNSSISNDKVLVAILNELKDINKKLND